MEKRKETLIMLVSILTYAQIIGSILAGIGGGGLGIIAFKEMIKNSRKKG